MSAMLPRKSTQAQIDYARAWNLAHPEVIRANKRKYYLKYRPPLKPIETIHQRFDRFYIPVPESGCWLWLGSISHNGYGRMGWNKHMWNAHRVAWTLFKGDIPDNVLVLHRCDVPSCVNPEHLFLGTQQDNIDDMWRKGRRGPMRGGRHKAKLTTEQVLLVRSLRGKVRQIDLAARFNITGSQISRIQRGQFYRHIPMELGQT